MESHHNDPAKEWTRQIHPADEEKFSQVLDYVKDIVFLLEVCSEDTYQFLFVNPPFLEATGLSEDQVIGKRIQEVIPEPAHALVLGHYATAIRERRAVEWQETSVYPAGRRVGEVRVIPIVDEQDRCVRLLGTVHDITDQQHAEDEREQLLARRNEAEERFRNLYETMAQGVVYQDASGAIVSANPAAERMLGLSVGEISGRISSDPRWRAVREDDTEFPGEEHPSMRALKTGESVLGVVMGVFNPNFGERRWLRVNAIPQFQNGATSPALVYATFEDITEERAAAAELRQTEQELRAAHEQVTGILESLTDAFIALDSEWTLTHVNAQGELFVRRTRDELINRNFWELFPEAVGSTFERQYRYAIEHSVAVSFEEFFPPLDTWFEVRAFPSENGLSIFFQNVNERKALETQKAQVAEREHKIATQLQDALQPVLPDQIPGLSVGKFTRPALDEAAVGGDFYDLFPLDKEQYALVIGDVSGKGLAAAQQLALIRNSLRTTLYLYRTPAQAAASLNAIVTTHDLLLGFVTAWIGVYNASTGEIVFCACGHEPALVRRSNSVVEVLPTICPPLGMAENAEYRDQHIKLASGDELLLYTDGLSESGPSRLELLGTDRLKQLLAQLPNNVPVQTHAEMLVAGAGAFANGAFRDDVAVLLARRH